MSCKINQLEADIKMLQDRLIERTAIFLKRDIEQALEINELKEEIKKLQKRQRQPEYIEEDRRYK